MSKIYVFQYEVKHPKMEFCFHLSFILSIEAILVQSWMPVKNILDLEQQPHHVPFKNDPFYNYKRYS